MGFQTLSRVEFIRWGREGPMGVQQDGMDNILRRGEVLRIGEGQFCRGSGGSEACDVDQLFNFYTGIPHLVLLTGEEHQRDGTTQCVVRDCRYKQPRWPKEIDLRPCEGWASRLAEGADLIFSDGSFTSKQNIVESITGGCTHKAGAGIALCTKHGHGWKGIHIDCGTGEFNKAYMAEMLGLAVATQLAQYDGGSRTVHTDCEAAKGAYDNAAANVVKFNPHWLLATAMHQGRTVPVIKVKAHPERWKRSAFYNNEDWGITFADTFAGGRGWMLNYL